jgi:hypothetical protein
MLFRIPNKNYLGPDGKAPAGMIFSCAQTMAYCGVVEVRSLEDALGATCGGPATAPCSDCGTALCAGHAERCELCNKTFCPSCLSFHQGEHPKPAVADQPAARRKKIA